MCALMCMYTLVTIRLTHDEGMTENSPTVVYRHMQYASSASLSACDQSVSPVNQAPQAVSQTQGRQTLFDWVSQAPQAVSPTFNRQARQQKRPSSFDDVIRYLSNTDEQCDSVTGFITCSKSWQIT